LIIAGEIPSISKDLRDQVYEHPDNRYGEYCQVIIGGESVQEGLNFKDVRHLFIVKPEWNMPTLDQVIGRTIRYRGHESLPPEKRSITIHRLCAVLHPSVETRDIASVDEVLYSLAEVKDIKMKQVIYAIKMAAVDCENNKLQNKRDSDEPNSRDCNYNSTCELTCLSESIPLITPINDTYNYYYGEQEKKKITELVQSLFAQKFSYVFEELLTEIRSRSGSATISSILLANSLYDMIVNNNNTSHSLVSNIFGIITIK
jgi:hypothetical protein